MSRPKGSKNKKNEILPGNKFATSGEALQAFTDDAFKESKEQFADFMKYKVTLALKNGEMYEAEGETLAEAIKQIEVPDLIKVLGTITATYKDKKVVRVCNALQLQRLFGKASKVKQTAKIIYIKFLASGL